MKLICDHCWEEITEEEFIEWEHALFHEEDCFLDYFMQVAKRYNRKDYLAEQLRMEE